MFGCPVDNVSRPEPLVIDARIVVCDLVGCVGQIELFAREAPTADASR
jgi:hypothetical protein